MLLSLLPKRLAHLVEILFFLGKITGDLRILHANALKLLYHRFEGLILALHLVLEACKLAFEVLLYLLFFFFMFVL